MLTWLHFLIYFMCLNSWRWTYRGFNLPWHISKYTTKIYAAVNARKPSVYKLIAFGLNSFHFYPAIYICTYSVVHFGHSRGTRATFQPSSSIFQACFAANLPSKSLPPFSIFFSICLRNQPSKCKECYFHRRFRGVNYRAERMTGATHGFIF